MSNKQGIKNIAENRKARHEYYVLESFEAGIELFGTEVKSIRAGGVNLKESWCDVGSGELLVKGMRISPYEQGNVFNRDPMRDKRLLVHRHEIARLLGQVKQQGLTIIPLTLYFKGDLVKVQVGLCKGKKNYDKRVAESERDAKREIARYAKVATQGEKEA